jgi:hypothetical protein
MTDSYVFDTEAIVAYLYGEPGHRTVAAILSDVFAGDADGVLAEANASCSDKLIPCEGERSEPLISSVCVSVTKAV